MNSFKVFGDLIATRINERKEERERFLISECMSDEEDDELHTNSKEAINIKVITPLCSDCVYGTT